MHDIPTFYLDNNSVYTFYFNFVYNSKVLL